MIECSLRRYYPDGDIDAKIRNDVHFFANFNFVRAMVRKESRRFADIAEEGNVVKFQSHTLKNAKYVLQASHSPTLPSSS